MRLVARFPEQGQVGAFVDSLKNMGFRRDEMIISDMAERQEFTNAEEATEAGMIFIKTERDGLGELEPFSEGVKGLKGETGILVAVKTPKHEADRVRSVMEQSGAIEIIQD